jgi:hypothetical protein
MSARDQECGIFHMALPEPGVTIAGTTTSWPIPAKAVASAPSCNTRRMVETAAHLMDHVFPLKKFI